MPSENEIDRLVVVILPADPVGRLTQQLISHKFYFTRVESKSGLLPESAVCLLVGIQHARYGTLEKLIRKCCEPRRQYIPTGVESQPFQPLPLMIEAQVGGATVYTIDVEHFERI